MENANEVYILLGKDKKAPGQWLNLKTTKAFMKATGCKYKKEDDQYLMDSELLKEYECYLKDTEEDLTEDKTDNQDGSIFDTLRSALKEELVQQIVDLFIQRVYGLSYPKIYRDTKYSKEDLILKSSEGVLEVFKIVSYIISGYSKIRKIVTPLQLKDEFADTMLFLEKKGFRTAYGDILDNDDFKISYGKVKIK